MPSQRPLGVKLIVVFLLFSAVGSVFAALGYWYALVYPPPFFYNVVSKGLSELFAFAPGLVAHPNSVDWGYFLVLTAVQTIDNIIKYQSAIGLFSANVVFYPVLSVVLVFVAWGLFRMRNWARLTTVVYAVLAFISTFIYGYLLFPSSDYSYSLVNMNIPMVLLSLAGLDLFRSLLIGLLFSLITAIPIIVYLFRDIQYEFQ